MAARVSVLIEGYAREGADSDEVQGTVTLVVDGENVIVVDPGMLADIKTLHQALRGHGLLAEQVSHVFLTHHHVDHTRYAGIFTKAKVFDYSSVYDGDKWRSHSGDEFQLSPDVRIIQTPGHTAECASLVVETEVGTVVITHAWWYADMTPVEDPLAEDQDALETSRKRILLLADHIIPGHGPLFSLRR